MRILRSHHNQNQCHTKCIHSRLYLLWQLIVYHTNLDHWMNLILNRCFLLMSCCPELVVLPVLVAVLERLAVVLVPAELGLSECFHHYLMLHFHLCLRRFHYQSLWKKILCWLSLLFRLKLIPVLELLQLAVLL